jgi:hypothetical protein
MKVEYNNLYTHFIFVTLNRMPLIMEQFREIIEKYITGIVNNMIMITAIRSQIILNCQLFDKFYSLPYSACLDLMRIKFFGPEGLKSFSIDLIISSTV